MPWSDNRQNTSALRAWLGRRDGRFCGPSFIFVSGVLLAFGAAAVSRHMLPPGLTIPATASLLLAGAAVAALIAWRSRQDAQAQRLSYWDVAGGLAFIGIGLSTLIEGDQLARLFEGMPSRK